MLGFKKKPFSSTRVRDNIETFQGKKIRYFICGLKGDVKLIQLLVIVLKQRCSLVTRQEWLLLTPFNLS